MKILTPEEEAAHNRKTWEGGLLGGLAGLAVGGLGVYAASARYHAFRQLSVPFRGFIITSSTIFAAVVSADRSSRAFERSRHSDYDYENASERAAASAAAGKTATQRFKQYVSEQRYPIVFGSWFVGMVAAGAIVGRNKYLTGQQKLVQARVYAQGLTLAVLVASFALESNDLRAGKGRWETVKVLDPDDPEHKRLIEKRIHHEKYQGEDQWMDMIEAEEQKMKARGQNVRRKNGGKQKQSEKEKEDDGEKDEQSEQSEQDGAKKRGGAKKKDGAKNE